MRSRRATEPKSAGAVPDDNGYRCLNVTEVLADLPSLDRDQLLLVKSLEEEGERRSVILDRVADLLVVQEAANHLRAISYSDSLPPAPGRELSPDLLDQMGGLLAKNAGRTAPRGLADPAGAATAATATALAPNALAVPTITAPPTRGRGARADKVPKPRKAPKAPSRSAPNGHIVPNDGRRARTGHSFRRILKVLTGVVLVALLAGGGVAYWMNTHSTNKTAPAAVILKAIPGTGYRLGTDARTPTGALSLAQVAQLDGVAHPVTALAKAGYVDGFRQLWANVTDNHQVTLAVYQFRTAAGASAYSQQLAAAARAQASASTPSFPVPEIVGAVGLGGGTTGSSPAQIIFSRGNYLVSVVASNGTGTADVREATLVAVVQYTGLLASQ